MRAAGAPEALIATEAARAHESDIQLTPADRRAWDIFVAVSGQWRWHPTANLRTGLDYQAVHVVAQMMETPINADLFRRIQWIEAGALEAYLRDARRR
ncbi:MAG: hypothetical protein E6R12_08640 [Sphingomonadales bacterium]|nr:MAG: hypothetical protein E6R12_08640 [Sphingomonadales bacterium]